MPRSVGVPGMTWSPVRIPGFVVKPLFLDESDEDGVDVCISMCNRRVD